MKKIAIYIIILVSLSATGCSTNRAPLSAGFGDSVNHNAAVHILPSKYASETVLNTDGTRAELGIERYKTGKVIPPSIDATSTLSAGGGS